MNNLISPQAREVLEVGRAHHWQFRWVDQMEIPLEPIYEAGWWYETLKEAPRQAAKRVAAIEAAGIPIKAIIIAHEAPKLLSAPKPDIKIPPVPTILPEAGKVTLKAGKVVILGASLVAGVIASVAVVSVAMVGLAIPLMMTTALVVDPKAIVVCQDGSMIEVCNWLT